MALFLKDKIVNYPSLDIVQKILTDEFFKRFDIGANEPYDVVNVEQLFYEGAIAGSEFLVYDANKLYLCYDLILNFSGAASANIGFALLSDEGNANLLYLQQNSIAYEAVAAVVWYAKNIIHIQNLYFSRMQAVQLNYMKFIGYRITY